MKYVNKENMSSIVNRMKELFVSKADFDVLVVPNIMTLPSSMTSAQFKQHTSVEITALMSALLDDMILLPVVR